MKTIYDVYDAKVKKIIRHHFPGYDPDIWLFSEKKIAEFKLKDGKSRNITDDEIVEAIFNQNELDFEPGIMFSIDLRDTSIAAQLKPKELSIDQENIKNGS